MTVSDFLVSPSADQDWLLIEEGVDQAREHELESIMTIANGYLGIRSSIAELGRLSCPSILIAGVYIYIAHEDLGPRLAVLPNCFHVKIAVEDRQLSLNSGRVLEHRRMLDLRQGVLFRQWRQQDSTGRITRLTYLQFASLADRHIVLHSVAVTAENYSGKVTLSTGIGPLAGGNTDVTLIAAESPATVMRILETEVAIATASELLRPPATRTSQRVAQGDEQWSWDASLGETVRLDRFVTIFTSRDVPSPTKAASDRLASIRALGVEAIVQAHVDAWRRKWELVEVSIAGDNDAQRALRFAMYHLIAAANPADERVSIGARGLTGPGYRGHVFWDTEIHMLPFYIFTDPPAARSLLMYRYHALAAARQKARARGYEGALYPWESADTGEEVTPRKAVAPDGRLVNILTGELEHHISADIAYAVWQYWRTTGDDAFILTAGAEILVETARFWVSRAEFDRDRQAHIRRVIGPDEYHEMVDDNAYTNTMASFNLECAANAAAILERDYASEWVQLSTRLGVTGNEMRAWSRLAAALITGFDPSTKLIEQFAGYFQLEEVDVAARRGGVPIDAYLEPERLRRSKAIKQADVVALSALLWEKWPVAVHETNFRYYEPRTTHGSSLSPAVHALVAARLGNGAVAKGYFDQAAEIDLANNMGNAAAGVHMGALGGLWQATVFGVAGLRVLGDGIAIDPHLLPGWSAMQFPLRWRGRSLRLHIKADPRQIEVVVESGDDLTVGILEGSACVAHAGRRYVIRGGRPGWGKWEEVDR
jgi:trehalose/maltose hydrolase-like predicted phosphorylase